MRILTALAATILLLHGTSGNAQEQTLTLQQSIDIALQNNLNVVQSQNNLSAAESQSRAAMGQYLPSLDASGTWRRTQTDQSGYRGVIQGTPVDFPASSETNGSVSAGLSAGLNVFDFLGREGSVSAANARETSAKLGVVRTRQAIVFQTVSDYLNVLRTEKLVTVAEENLKRDQRQLERIVESNRVGALSLADVYRQQSQVASDELSVISATNNHLKSKADLLALIGLDARQDYRIVDATLPATIDTMEMRQLRSDFKGIGVLQNRALQARPDFKASLEELNAADGSVTSAYSGYYPALGAFGGYNLNGEKFENLSDNKSLSWGLNVRWNIFDGFLREQQIQTAEVSRRNAEIAKAQTERDVTVEVKKAVLDLDAAMKALQVTEKAMVSAAEDRKIAEERYNLGAGTLLDLLVANASYVNAEANRVNAVYGYLTAKYNLEFALGEREY
jgi:outer membrane protein